MPIPVLIIDPDIAFVTVVRRALEQGNEFEVRVFTSGRAGIESAIGTPPAVIVLDFSLRDMTIQDVVTTLRDSHPDLPIIVTPRTKDQLLQAAEINAQRSIGKPYMARQLIPILRELAGVPEPTEASFTPPLPRRLPEQALGSALQRPTTPPNEPPIPPGATIRDLMQSLRIDLDEPPLDIAQDLDVTRTQEISPIPIEPPEFSFEGIEFASFARVEADLEIDIPIIAEQALKITGDDTIPLSRTTVDAVIRSADIEKAERGYTVPLQATVPLTVVQDDSQDDSGDDAFAEAEDGDFGVDPVLDSSLDEQAMASVTLAVKLTQLALDPALSATLLSHEGSLIAAAGSLDTDTINEIHTRIQELLAKATRPEDDLVRDIRTRRGMEFGLFSRRTADAMRLTLVFAPDTAFRVIRVQSQQIEQALLKFPQSTTTETVTEYESNNAVVAEDLQTDTGTESIDEPTPNNAPTRPRRPEGLTEALDAASGLVSGKVLGRDSESDAPKLAPLGFLWTPRAGSLDEAIRAQLPFLLTQIADDQGWHVLQQQVTERYVLLTVEAEADLPPPAVVESLMFDSAELIGIADLWADQYLAVTSAREITKMEIETFLAFRSAAVTS